MPELDDIQEPDVNETRPGLSMPDLDDNQEPDEDVRISGEAVLEV